MSFKLMNGTTFGLGDTSLFSLSSFGFDNTQVVSIASGTSSTGKAAFDPLTLSFNHNYAATELLSLLDTGTTIAEVDVVGYTSAGSGSGNGSLVDEYSFGLAKAASLLVNGGGTVSDTQSASLTYTSEEVQHFITAADGSVQASRSSWTTTTNAAGFTNGTGTTPTVFSPTLAIHPSTEATTEGVHYVRFIGQNGVVLQIGRAQYFQLNDFSLSAEASGKATFGPLTLDFTQTDLMPQLMQMLTKGTSFAEIDVVGYASNAAGAPLVEDYSLGLATATTAATAATSGSSPANTMQFQYDAIEVQDFAPGRTGSTTVQTSTSWNNIRNIAGFTTNGTSPASPAAPSLTKPDNAEACFAAGTLIATPTGEQAVETIAVGDLVTTVQGSRPVIWVGYRNVDVDGLTDPDDHWLVRIRPSAFGDSVPRRDLWVTQEHCILVESALIPARMLINGGSILLDRTRSCYSYHHIELERHGILLAEGLTTESYLDTGNRTSFSNAPARSPGQVLDPDSVRWRTDAAAPLVISRDKVEPIWTRLATRAAGLGYGDLSSGLRGGRTNDPDLRLLLEDGRSLEPSSRLVGRWTFHIPSGARAVQLLSRSARPSESIGPYVDDRRRLGVAIETLVLWQGLDDSPIPAAKLALPGWHAPEGRVRWTNGSAALDLPVAHGLVMLDVHVVATMDYMLAEGATEVAKAA